MKIVNALLVSSLIAIPAVSQQVGGKPAISAQPESAPASVPAVNTPSAATASPNVGANYVIGADDSIQVTVWEQPNLSGTLLVRPDGKVSLPLIGDVMAAGLTPTQLGTEITARLKKFVTDPTVNVAVLAVNSKRVILIGEVGHVGQLTMSPGMTVLQAIASAGGLTPYANKKHIYILRGEPGKQQKIKFDYKKALATGDMQGITLLAGDTIVVPG